MPKFKKVKHPALAAPKEKAKGDKPQRQPMGGTKKKLVAGAVIGTLAAGGAGYALHKSPAVRDTLSKVGPGKRVVRFVDQKEYIPKAIKGKYTLAKTKVKAGYAKTQPARQYGKDFYNKAKTQAKPKVIKAVDVTKKQSLNYPWLFVAGGLGLGALGVALRKKENRQAFANWARKTGGYGVGGALAISGAQYFNLLQANPGLAQYGLAFGAGMVGWELLVKNKVTREAVVLLPMNAISKTLGFTFNTAEKGIDIVSSGGSKIASFSGEMIKKNPVVGAAGLYGAYGGVKGGLAAAKAATAISKAAAAGKIALAQHYALTVPATYAAKVGVGAVGGYMKWAIGAAVLGFLAKEGWKHKEKVAAAVAAGAKNAGGAVAANAQKAKARWQQRTQNKSSP